MKPSFLSAIILSILFLVDISSATTYPLYNCQVSPLSGGTPSNPNVYVLQNNISNVGYCDCLHLLDNTILDLNGYWILSSCNVFTYSNYGVRIQGDNITVRNGNIQSEATNVGNSIAIGIDASHENIDIYNLTLIGLGHQTGFGGKAYTIYGASPFTGYNLKVYGYEGFALYLLGDNSIITSSTFNSTDGFFLAGKDIYDDVGADNNYINGCFDPTRVLIYGSNVTLIRTCPPPSFCPDGICETEWGENITNCPADCGGGECVCSIWISSITCLSNTTRAQTRTCSPAGCDIEYRIINDTMCSFPQTTTFFNKYMIATIILLAVSGGFAMLVGGESSWIVFLSTASFLSLMMSVIGVYPKWVIIIALIGVSGAFAKLIIGMVKG